MNIRIYKGESNHLAGMALHVLEGEGIRSLPRVAFCRFLHTLLVTPGGFSITCKSLLHR